MPGENCVIFGCSTSKRHKGVSIFKVPSPNNDVNKKWNSDLISIITRGRQVDELLKERIQSCKLYICERHFSADQFWIYPSRKTLKEGALPTLNLPQKSFKTSSTTCSTLTSRSSAAIEKREHSLFSLELTPPSSPISVYKNVVDFKQRIVNLSLGDNWKISLQDKLAIVTCHSQDYVLTKFEIYIEHSLVFSLRGFGLMLPEDHHEIYQQYGRSFFNVTISNFIHNLEKLFLCKVTSVILLDFSVDLSSPFFQFSSKYQV